MSKQRPGFALGVWTTGVCLVAGMALVALQPSALEGGLRAAWFLIKVRLGHAAASDYMLLGRTSSWLGEDALRDAVAGSDDINVLNGIAWDAEGERVYLTGKYWPTLFIIERPGREASTGEAR